MSNYRRAAVPGGTFFFTVTLADRTSSLLTDQVDVLRHCYAEVQRERPFQTVAVCVLPDHLHAVWRLPPKDADFSTRWQRIKARFSRHLPPRRERSHSKVRHREKGIWQRRFWEHTIRDEDDLRRYVDYIHFNPVKHGLVERVADWPYSSFHRYLSEGKLPLDWGGPAANQLVGDVGE